MRTGRERTRRGTAGAPLVHDVAALERTALSWERTAFAVAALGLLLVKVVDGGFLLQAAGLGLVAMAGLIVVVLVPVGYRRTRARVDPQVPGSPFTSPDRWRPRALLATALAVSLSAVAVGLDLWVAGVS